MTTSALFGKNGYKSDIVLGRKYQDKQTGISGVATGIHFYQHACERATLEYINPKDGNLQELTFDAPRLTDIETDVTATTDRTGGPAGPGENARGSAR